MSLHPILKVVASDGCRSYLIACPETRECLLVDPKHGKQELYASLLDAYGLKLVALLDTHTHADHLSGSAAWIASGVPLWMSHATRVGRPRRALEQGQEVQVGELCFEVLEVPGHTPDSIALSGHGLLVSGDSLFIGGLARADFRGSDPAELFESVKTRLLTLADDTLVLPGHDYGDILFSTIGCERETNPALACADGAAYAAQLHAVEGAGNSAAVDEMLALNLEAEPELPVSSSPAAACCASAAGPALAAEIDELTPRAAHDVHLGLSDAERWIDVRDPFEFEHGHIPGTTNLPLSELGFHLSRLRTDEPLYFSCRSGVRSMTAARTLMRLGVVKQPVNVGGGILAWQQNAFEIDGLPST